VIFYSFTNYDIVTPPHWIGLKNYLQMAKDPTFWLALRNSIIYLIATPTVMALSIVVAIIVNRKLPSINIFRALYYIPAISGRIAIGITWRTLFDANGMINSMLIWLGILKDPVQALAEPAYTLPLLISLTVWAGIGYYMMVFLAGLQGMFSSDFRSITAGVTMTVIPILIFFILLQKQFVRGLTGAVKG
jgi:putative chitobiose transport system permease protein